MASSVFFEANQVCGVPQPHCLDSWEGGPCYVASTTGCSFNTPSLNTASTAGTMGRAYIPRTVEG